MSQERTRVADFEQIVVPHLNAAYNLARWIMNNDQDAEDMVQEAYLRAYKYYAGFQGANSRSWLLKIVRNTCYTWLRQNRSGDQTVELEDELYESENEAFDPEALSQHQANDQMVRQAMQELPAEFREIIILRELEEMSYKEIASIIGIPIGTVMSRLARAHQRLKQRLATSFDEEGINEL